MQKQVFCHQEKSAPTAQKFEKKREIRFLWLHHGWGEEPVSGWGRAVGRGRVDEDGSITLGLLAIRGRVHEGADQDE